MLRNDGTRVAGSVRAGDVVFVDGDDLRALWQDVLDRVRLWRAEHPEGAALAVVARHGRHFDVELHQLERGEPELAHSAEVLAHSEPVAVIVGRHSECDLDLQTTHASLRHAAIVAWPRAGDGARARVAAIDLRSELGLTVVDARGTRAATRITSSTALRFHVAGSELTAMIAQHDEPFPVRWADQLEAQLAGALVDVDTPAGPASAGSASAGRAAPSQSSWERSIVLVSSSPGHRPPVLREDQLAVRCTRDAVERGVVLGRYVRCDRTTALASEENVSRVHALVFAAYGALWVVDTASTGGTSLLSPTAGAIQLGEGRRIARLPPDARLYLAGTEAVLVVT